MKFKLDMFYAKHGIEHQTSCLETIKQNSTVERKHQDILNVAKDLLYQFGLLKEFWHYAVQHAVFLINKIPSPVIANHTPFYKLFHKHPDYATV